MTLTIRIFTAHLSSPPTRWEVTRGSPMRRIHVSECWPGLSTLEEAFQGPLPQVMFDFYIKKKDMKKHSLQVDFVLGRTRPMRIGDWTTLSRPLNGSGTACGWNVLRKATRPF